MKRTLSILVIACVLSPLFAQGQAAPAAAPAVAPAVAPAMAPAMAPAVAPAMVPAVEAPMAYGLPLLGTRKEEGRDFVVLSDQPGKEILLAVEAEPDDARLQALSHLTASLRSWSGADFSEIRVINYPDRFQLLAIATRFEASGQEMVDRMPGGLQFFYIGGAYEYDFRFKAGDFFLRIRGLYSSLSDLSVILANALKDPVAYINATDPLYALKKFEEEEARIAAVQASMNDTAKKLQSSFNELQTEMQAKIRELQNGLAAQIQASQAETTQLKKDMAAISAKESADHLRSIPAIAAALNGGKAIRSDIIQKILDLRAADPKFDKGKAIAKLKEAGLVVTQKEADAVFLAAFGE